MSPKSPWSSSGHWFFAFRLKRLDIIIFIINHHHCCRYHCQNLDSKSISRHLKTIGHSSQAALSEKTMKVINRELTSEDALSINSILFISIWLVLISSFHLLQQHHILQLGHLSVLPNPVCTSTKMHQNASKVRKLVVKKLQILHKTLLSWSHACILRKRTSPLQRQFEDYTENNSHHHQKCKIIE